MKAFGQCSSYGNLRKDTKSYGILRKLRTVTDSYRKIPRRIAYVLLSSISKSFCEKFMFVSKSCGKVTESQTESLRNFRRKSRVVSISCVTLSMTLGTVSLVTRLLSFTFHTQACFTNRTIIIMWCRKHVSRISCTCDTDLICSYVHRKAYITNRYPDFSGLTSLGAWCNLPNIEVKTTF